MGAIARSLSSLVPATLFYKLVKLATKFPDYAAQTTVSFIKSPLGVRQALHLAKDEMHTITDDKWDEEVWGAAISEGTNNRDTFHSNLIMYWGRRVCQSLSTDYRCPADAIPRTNGSLTTRGML